MGAVGEVKVLCLSKVSDEAAWAIEQVGVDAGTRVKVLRAPSREEAEQLIAEADVVYGTRLTPEAFARARRLRWIHAPAVGVDRLLHPALVQSPVLVTCSRGLHAHSLSEHVFALMLALSRRLPEFWADHSARRWQRREGEVLAGATLLVVGLGAVGSRVAALGHAFGMRVLGVKRDPRVPVGGEGWIPVDEMGGPADLLTMLRRADWVVLCVPLTPATHRLMGRAQLEAMKPTSYLINVARGEVVDEAALVEALRTGRIAGAGLDVFSREPLPSDSVLWELPNVVLTPHIGGSMIDYEGKALQMFLDNLRRFLRGEPLQNVVKKDLGY